MGLGSCLNPPWTRASLRVKLTYEASGSLYLKLINGMGWLSGKTDALYIRPLISKLNDEK